MARCLKARIHGEKNEEFIGEIGPAVEDDSIYEYDFLGTTGYGFEVPTEDVLACNFICVKISTSDQREAVNSCKLFTILIIVKTYEDIGNLLYLVEQNISFE